jgi:hypothetical protein
MNTVYLLMRDVKHEGSRVLSVASCPTRLVDRLDEKLKTENALVLPDRAAEIAETVAECKADAEYYKWGWDGDEEEWNSLARDWDNDNLIVKGTTGDPNAHGSITWSRSDVTWSIREMSVERPCNCKMPGLS